jgi:hypothetical protein
VPAKLKPGSEGQGQPSCENSGCSLQTDWLGYTGIAILGKVLIYYCVQTVPFAKSPVIRDQACLQPARAKMGCGPSSPGGKLESAVRSGDVEAARAHLAEGADPNQRCKFHWRQHGFGFSGGSGGGNAGVSETHTEETPVLIMATERCDVAMAALLLDTGADPDATQNNSNDDSEMTALLMAVSVGATEIVKLLLDKGASTYRAPVVAAACAAGQPECVRILLEAGAPAKESERGFTPLHFCALQGREPSMEAPLLPPMDDAAPVPSGETYAECTRLVIELAKLSKEDIDARDEGSAAVPALSYAARWGSIEVARALVRAGASRDIRGPDGMTPAQYARDHGHKSLASELDAM